MPNNDSVNDTKPQMLSAFDITPNNLGEVNPPVDQLFSVTITSGMLMPIMAITYSATQTFMSPITS